jgi:carbon storage regulator
MLILTRFEDQVIVIGENGEIKIRVLRIKGNQVKIGIEADKDIPVNREEIYLKIQEEKELES